MHTRYITTCFSCTQRQCYFGYTIFAELQCVYWRLINTMVATYILLLRENKSYRSIVYIYIFLMLRRIYVRNKDGHTVVFAARP